MRIIRFFVVLVISLFWIWLINAPRGILPALGKVMDPYKGFWANAEPVHDAAHQFHVPDSSLSNVTINFDDRLVPHVTARNDHDLYKTQGYLHAYYRLWQMDMQARAAA